MMRFAQTTVVSWIAYTIDQKIGHRIGNHISVIYTHVSIPKPFLVQLGIL